MNQENEAYDLSPTQSDYRKAMSENLHGCDINNVRVLSYQNKAPAPPEVIILLFLTSNLEHLLLINYFRVIKML